MIVIVVILCIWFFYLTRPVKLSKYKCKYAVVTGATGGCGTELVSQLVKQLHVIVVGRNREELQKLIDKHQDRVLAFQFDFADDLSTFAPKFSEFMIQNNI